MNNEKFGILDKCINAAMIRKNEEEILKEMASIIKNIKKEYERYNKFYNEMGETCALMEDLLKDDEKTRWEISKIYNKTMNDFHEAIIVPFLAHKEYFRKYLDKIEEIIDDQPNEYYFYSQLLRFTLEDEVLKVEEPTKDT